MNLRPLGPQPSALPGYAKPRGSVWKSIIANVSIKCNTYAKCLLTLRIQIIKQMKCAAAVSPQEIGYERRRILYAETGAAVLL